MSRLPRLFTLLVATCISLSTQAGTTGTGVHLPEYTTTILPNGATVLLMPRHDVPMIAASVLVRGGSLADTAGKEGTASLLADLMEKGAGERDALAFAQTVDGAGGSLQTRTQPQVFNNLDAVPRCGVQQGKNRQLQRALSQLGSNVLHEVHGNTH